LGGRVTVVDIHWAAALLTRIRQKRAARKSRLGRALLQQWSRLDGFRLGIAGRLGAAFVAVAVLATAANVIAEHGSQIIRPLVVTRIYRASVSTPPTQMERLKQAAAAEKEVTGNQLIEAIDQLEYAVERCANLDSPENADLLKSAGKRVGDRYDAYLAELSAVGADGLVRSLKQRVNTLRAVGDEVVHRAQERRTLLASYWNRFESIDSQVKKSLDKNNWKIFGRVISRQSLLRLSQDLDEIRRQSTQLDGRDFVGVPGDALTSSQRRFRSDLEADAVGLSRLQGPQWLENLRKTDLEWSEAQARLSQIDHDNSQGLAPFKESAQELKSLVRSAGAVARKKAQAPALVHAPPAVAPSVTAVASPIALPSATAVAPPIALPSTTAVASPIMLPSNIAAPSPTALPSPAAAPSPAAQSYRGVLLASISVVVLLFLLVISVTIVRSIVVPIRQFMATTDRLARGDEAARFARGGIKELDALALSFNRMAESLAEAREVNREYQNVLESRVDERTRQLQHLAEHDPLTGLPNRRQLVGRLDTALQRAAVAGTQVAVYFIDLDNFKNINDSMGHSFGDLVLKSVAQRLREAAGASGFAARLGGDEFTVIQEDTGDQLRVTELGDALVRAFQRPLVIEGRELIVSISGGASIYPDHERESDALLRAADAALFRAKNSGRARVALFSPELLEAASHKFTLEQGLRRALERGELELWFQPEVSFATLGAQLVEGLLRWRTPDGKYLAPGDFLSVAEDSGVIRDIDNWVLRTGFQYAAEWHHGDWPDTRVALNVSARQLLDTRFVTTVREMLDHYQLPARCIEIELTETVLQTEAATVEVLRELRRLGVSVALDDFGTGYSTLASLERLPLTRVKLDRSLIDTIDNSARSLAIARAIMGLCENLGLEVTAEGIERPGQLALMLANPATTLQGYLFSPPVRANEVLALFPQLRSRMEELMIAVPVATEAPTVVARDRVRIRQ
jgi:diguanylate cyclase (GGDEF)-like protein